MLRNIVAGVVGFTLWWIVGGVLIGFILPSVWPEYQIANQANLTGEGQNFSSSMMIARLFSAAVANVAAGYITVYIAKVRVIAWFPASVLMLVMLYAHLFVYWSDWPIWYHGIFLMPFIPLYILGGRFVKTKQ